MEKIYLKDNSIIARLSARGLSSDNVAIVVWNTIFIYGVTKEQFMSNKTWLRHEVQHVRQWRRYGFFGFLLRYMIYSIKYGYENNPLEAEARESESDYKSVNNYVLYESTIYNTDGQYDSLPIKKQYSWYNFTAIAIFLGFLYFIVAKAWSIPITYDESSQVLYYAKLPIKDILLYTNPWPTNHILNSLLIKLFTSIFGDNIFVERLPNVLAFFIFYYFTVAFSRKFFDYMIIGLLLTTTVLLCNPYLLDFFSLARGYGLALGFEMMALYYSYMFFLQPSTKLLSRFELALFLMIMSNFSWLSLALSIQGFVFLYILLSKQYQYIVRFFVWVTIAFLYSFSPIKRMTETDQFVYWSGNGLYRDTLEPLVSHYLYHYRAFFLEHSNYIIILSLLIIFIFIYEYLFQSRRFLSYFPYLLLMTLGITLVQNKVLGTPFLTGRTALLFYPIISMIVLSVFKIIKVNRLYFYVFSIALILLNINHLYSNYNRKLVEEWNFDHHTKDLLAYLDEVHQKSKDSISLTVYWIFEPSVKYHMQRDGYDWLELSQVREYTDTVLKSDFYYTREEDTARIDKSQMHIDTSWGNIILYQNDHFNPDYK